MANTFSFSYPLLLVGTMVLVTSSKGADVPNTLEVHIEMPTPLGESWYNIMDHFEENITVNSMICPRGMYCVGSSDDPLLCPPGTYQPFLGAQTYDQCLQCPLEIMTTICPAAGLVEPIDCLNASHVSRYSSYCAAFVVGSEPSSSPMLTTTTITTTSAATTSRPQPPKANDTATCADGMTWGYVDDNSTAAACIVCPRGYFCVNGTTMTECSAGTFNENEGGTACEACAWGTYSMMDTARVEQCPICPTNYVCETTTSIRACPLHTTAPQGSTSMIQCQCLAGYECQYVQRITLSITFNSTLQSITNIQGNSVLMGQLLNQVAAACHVNVSDVKFIRIQQDIPPVQRRLLSSSPQDVLPIDHHHHQGLLEWYVAGLGSLMMRLQL